MEQLAFALVAVGLVFAGLARFAYLMEHSGRYTPDDGAVQVFAATACMLASLPFATWAAGY